MRDRTAVIEGAWKPEYRRAVRSELAVDRLLYYPGNGVHTSVEFLRDLPQIRTLAIAQAKRCDVGALRECSALEEIGLVNWHGELPRLDGLPRLHTVGVDHGRGALNVLSVSSLKHLAYGRFPLVDFEEVSRLTQLEALRITGGRLRTTRGLGRLSKLEWFSLVSCRQLESIVELGGLPALRKLGVDGCSALPDFAEVGKLGSLEELNVQSRGRVESIRPLAACKRLRSVVISRMEIGDGSIKFLLDLPELRDARVGPTSKCDSSERELYDRIRERSDGDTRKY